MNTGKVIVQRFSGLNYLCFPGVLVARHAPFTWGRDPAEAVRNSVVLEEIAKISFFSRLIDNTVSEISQELLEKHYLRKHGSRAYYGQRKTE